MADNKRKTVIHIVPKWVLGGGTIYLSNLLKNSAERSNLFRHIVICGSSRSSGPKLPEKVEFISLNYFCLSGVVALYNFFKENAVQCIHCHGRNTLPVAMLGLGMKIPVIMQFHGYYGIDRDDNHVKRLLSKIWDWIGVSISKAIVTTSEAESGRVQSLWPTQAQKNVEILTRVSVEINPQVAMNQATVEITQRRSLGRVQIISLGSHGLHQKGLDRLLSLCADLQRRGIRCDINVFFRKERVAEWSELEEAISLQNLRNVHLYPAIEDVWSHIISCSDALISTSRFEGRNMAIQEAFHLGMPVIATDCIGQSELLSPAWAFVLNNDCVSAWADVVATVMDVSVRAESAKAAELQVTKWGGIDCLQKEFSFLYSSTRPGVSFDQHR